jgi:hypothetical protein
VALSTVYVLVYSKISPELPAIRPAACVCHVDRGAQRTERGRNPRKPSQFSFSSPALRFEQGCRTNDVSDVTKKIILNTTH